MPLLIRTTHQTEMIYEQEVTFEPLKFSSHMAFAISGDLPDSHLRVVITDSNRNSAEEIEGPLVTFQERFRAFPWKRLHVDGVGIRQRHHKQSHLDRLAIQNDIGEPIVDLSLTRWMAQWQENFAVTLFPFTNRFLHNRHTTGVVVLVTQTLKYSCRRVALLSMNASIVLKNLVNDRQKRLQFRRSRLRQPVTRWLAVSQNLCQRVPVNAVLDTRRPLAQFAVQNATANLNPLIHVGEHPCLPQQANSDDFGNSESLK